MNAPTLTPQAFDPSRATAPDLIGTDITAALPADFRLQSGMQLEQTDVVARLYGPKDAPVVVAAGGISAGRVLFAKEDSTETAPGWWEGVAGPGEALDLNRFRVLSIEFAPRLPASKVYTITTHDQARLVKLLLDKINVDKIYNFVGASYGAMIGLAFAELYPDAVERLCIISAAHRAHPMATAFRGLQRRMLKFGQDNGKPAEGISLARQLAMTTYRSDAEFSERFDGPAPEAAGGNYVVCQYLRARGDAYSATDVNRWISMSDSLDRHRVDPSKIKAKVFLAAVPTDRLVPYDDMKALHEQLRDSVFIEFPSLYGHDAFLKEIKLVSDIVRTSLKE
jgi:homoserine O-acetyltransferase